MNVKIIFITSSNYQELLYYIINNYIITNYLKRTKRTYMYKSPKTNTVKAQST